MFFFVIVIVVFLCNLVELIWGLKYLGQCLNVIDILVCKFDLSFYWLIDWRLVNVGYCFGGNYGVWCYVFFGDENNVQIKEKRIVMYFVG